MLKDNLKSFRKKCGFTQQLVSSLLKMERSTYTYYELGKTQPNVENLTKLSKLYKISIDELINGTPYQNENSDSLVLADNGMVYSSDSQLSYLDKINLLCFDEKELIALYRQLPDDKRMEIITEMKSTLDRLE